MKNKKGFTIVELVIVIAVIAILAAVLIPTFSGVVQRANQSAALQEARAALTSVISMSDKGQVTDGAAFIVGDSTIFYKNSKLDESNTGDVDSTPAQVIFSKKYAIYDDTANVDNITAITDAGQKLIGKSLYNKDTLTVTVTEAGETPTVQLKEGETVKATFKIAVSPDFSEKVIVVIPNQE